MKILITLFVLLFSSSVFSEIVTLDDGRVIDLKADGTFTVISKKTNIIDNSYHDSINFLLDLTGVAKHIISTTFRPVEVFIVAGSIYLIMTFIIHNFIKFLEKKYDYN